MITGYVGKPGHGKTLEAVRQVLLEHDAGAHVYANIPLNVERFTLITPATLLSVQRGECACGCTRLVILLDEVGLWLPARRSLQLPMSWIEGFSQTRKSGWDLIWTSQTMRRVDTMLRDVTSFVYACNAWVWPVEMYIYERYEPEYFMDRRRRLGRDVRRRSRRASAAYDTLLKVAAADHVADRRDPYAQAGGQGVAVAAPPADGPVTAPADNQWRF